MVLFDCPVQNGYFETSAKFFSTCVATMLARPIPYFSRRAKHFFNDGFFEEIIFLVTSLLENDGWYFNSCQKDSTTKPDS